LHSSHLSVILTLAPAAILSAPPILFTHPTGAGIASLYEDGRFISAAHKKAHKKKTSRLTGNAYYNTVPFQGQALFSRVLRFFPGKRANQTKMKDALAAHSKGSPCNTCADRL
jgi:hypothetical protein